MLGVYISQESPTMFRWVVNPEFPVMYRLQVRRIELQTFACNSDNFPAEPESHMKNKVDSIITTLPPNIQIIYRTFQRSIYVLLISKSPLEITSFFILRNNPIRVTKKQPRPGHENCHSAAYPNLISHITNPSSLRFYSRVPSVLYG